MIKRAGTVLILLLALPLSGLNYRHWRFSTPDSLNHAHAEQCLDAVHEAYGRLSRHFPVISGIPLRFMLYRGAITGYGSPYAGGYYNRASHTLSIQFIPLLIQQGRLESIIAHEMVHAALAGLGDTPLPLWLEEGTAAYYSGERLDVPVHSMELPDTLELLSQKIAAANTEQSMEQWAAGKAHYQTARSLVVYLIHRSSGEQFIAMLGALKQGLNIDIALHYYCRSSQSELEKRLSR